MNEVTKAHARAEHLAFALRSLGHDAERHHGNVKILGTDVSISAYPDGAHVWRLYGDRVISWPKTTKTLDIVRDVRAAIKHQRKEQK